MNQPCILGDSGLISTEQAAGGIVMPGSGACLVSRCGRSDTLLVTTRACSQGVKRLIEKDTGWRRLLRASPILTVQFASLVIQVYLVLVSDCCSRLFFRYLFPQTIRLLK